MNISSHPIPQAEPNYQRSEFIRSELAMCSTFTILANMKYEVGNRNSAARSLAHGEEVYAGVLPLVLDPGHFRHLTSEQVQQFTVELTRLRESLDRLHRTDSSKDRGA